MREDLGSASPEERQAGLPRKRMAASVLFFDSAGDVMVVETTYKEHWELPGGVVESQESPRTAAFREVAEELGLKREIGRLLGVDYVPDRIVEGRLRPEGVVFVYDGGELTTADVGRIQLQPEELRSFRFVSVEEAAPLLSPLIRRRLGHCVAARHSASLVELDNGHPVEF